MNAVDRAASLRALARGLALAGKVAVVVLVVGAFVVGEHVGHRSTCTLANVPDTIPCDRTDTVTELLVALGILAAGVVVIYPLYFVLGSFLEALADLLDGDARDI